MTAAELWDRLKADDLVAGELPKHDRPHSPWYVRAMLGVAGWIGAIFLLFFIGMAFAFIMKEAAYAAVAGAACCAIAFGLFVKFDDNDFAEQFALAISLVGQVLLIFGIAEYLKFEDPAFYLAIAATQAVLALLIPNFLHRVLAVSGTAIALALAVNQMALHGLAAPLLCAGLALIWLEPGYWVGNGRLWRPVGYGLVLALLLVETFRLFGAEQLFGMAGPNRGWFALHGALLGRVLTAAVLVWVVVVISRREGSLSTSRVAQAAVGAAVVVGLISLQAPGLASALLILLLGFAAGNHLITALGIFSLLGFVTHFYYSLHATLLEKSGLLALAGILCLAVYFLVRRAAFLSAAGEGDHA